MVWCTHAAGGAEWRRTDMFGKTRDLIDNGTIDGMTTENFFGDETAADEAAQIGVLRERVVQAESQISSQFTSLATYAQIAQEQIALARAEAKASTERSEHRLTELIERERADRISAANVDAPNGSGRHVTARLDALEHGVAQIRATLDECFAQQMALAEAINRLFEQGAASQVEPAASDTKRSDVAIELESAGEVVAPRERSTAQLQAPSGASSAGPIPGLSLRLDVTAA